MAMKFRRAQGAALVLVGLAAMGWTTSACAQILRKAGASEVRVWTVARGL